MECGQEGMQKIVPSRNAVGWTVRWAAVAPIGWQCSPGYPVAAPKACQTVSADSRHPEVEPGGVSNTCALCLERLEWTGRQVSAGRIGRIAADEPSLRNQLGCAAEDWRKRVASVPNKRSGLRRVSGWPAALKSEAGKRGIQGIALSREIFGIESGGPPPGAN